MLWPDDGFYRMRILLAFLINMMVNFAVGLLVARFLGPDQFGRFALAIGIGAVVQVLLFDWIRLAAARFYSEQARAAQPELRATLDATLLGLVAAVVLIGVALIAARVSIGLPPEMLAAALCFAAINGAFDYQAALLRARFADGAYGRLVLTKNGLALVLTAGTAWVTGSAFATLAASCLGLLGAMFALRAVTRDANLDLRAARTGILGTSLAYGVPLSTSTTLYLLIPLANRALAADWFDFAEAGQLALAQDVGLRLVLAIGTALDVLLFQLAVRAEDLHGAARGREQVSRNMGVILAITLPAIAGIWLVLPSFELLIVPPEFRGAFVRDFTALLPGFFCFGLASFALAPAFQITQRTWPVSVAAGIACLADLALVLVLPRGGDVEILALAQTGALGAGFLALLGFSIWAGARLPRWRDMAACCLATAIMVWLTMPLRALEPGAGTLCLQALAGALVYGGLATVLDLAGLRTAALGLLQARKERSPVADARPDAW
ncbi:MAG: teichoic acid transporter [Hyphomicrobiales bacterium]|nr:teichoic acid transporter [Hyphomicrobiales bacterium]